MSNLYQKYFNQDLAKQLRPENSYLNNRCYFDLSDEEILYANMFISIFEAGDKFESNYGEIGKHHDITKDVLYKYPQIRSKIDYYSKIYGFYRDYTWKILCDTGNDISQREVLVQKFFFWCRDVNKYGYENIYSDRQIREDVNNDKFFIKPFIDAYLYLVKSDNIIILPKAKRIVRLNGLSIDDLLAQRNNSLCKLGGGTAEMDLIDAINQALEDDDDE